MNDAQLVRGVQTPRRLPENFRNLGDGKWTFPREGLAEGFAFQKLHRDVRRAVIGVGLPASEADFHERQCNSPAARILTELLLQRE